MHMLSPNFKLFTFHNKFHSQSQLEVLCEDICHWILKYPTQKTNLPVVHWATNRIIKSKPVTAPMARPLLVGRRFAAALLPRLFGTNPRSHHKGATGRVRTGNQRLPILCLILDNFTLNHLIPKKAKPGSKHLCVKISSSSDYTDIFINIVD